MQVPQDDQGRSKGWGIIKFEERSAAKEAIETMDKAKFNDREVIVRFDRSAN